MDGRGFLYVTDVKNDEVRRYRLEGNYYETIYTVVAGGHGRGSAFHQLQMPTNIFVDGEQTVYVSDKGNNRVMKWKIGAEQGIVVAGGKGMGNDLEHLNHPRGLFVDVKGTIYIADYKNHRVMRWRTKSHGTVIVGGNGSGHQAHQLNGPMSLSVDRHNNLYVVDCFNHRVQRFSVTDQLHSFSDIRWTSNADTVAGGHSCGHQENKLDKCSSLDIDVNGNIIVTDFNNNRIVEWEPGATRGQIIAGGNGRGNKLNQLNQPSDVIVDKEKTSLLICDYGNRRVVRWSRRQGQQGKIVINMIDCWGLTIDNKGFLYVTDIKKHEVRRYQLEGKYDIINVTCVAGGHDIGNLFNQLNHPSFVAVDQYCSVYVSDTNNHRVMKWLQNAKEGTIVAGGPTEGVDRTQLCYPGGLFVDSYGIIYVVDSGNHRVMKWLQNAKEGTIVAGGPTEGVDRTQLCYPGGLFVDSYGIIYVVDSGNHRVMRWYDGMSDLVAGENKSGQSRNQLCSPEGLTFDLNGNLYVADMLNHRIQRFSTVAS